MTARAATAGRVRSRPKSRAAAFGGVSEHSLLLTATLCLLAFGAVMIFSASSTTQILSDGGLSNSAYFLKRTLIFGAVGLVLMRLLAVGGVRMLRGLTPVLVVASVAMLMVVLAIGPAVNGAHRWFGSGLVQVQPSELAKLALILYGAHLLASEPKRARTIHGMAPFLLIVGFCCALIVVEPDLGTAIVIAFAVCSMLVAAGARIRDLALIAAVLAFLGLLFIVVEPYRAARITGFLHPGSDTSGTGFQALQAKIALGSGGIFGKGLGDGVQKAYYLPEAHTDMIAAVIGEEIGFIGIGGLVGLFALIGFAGFRTAQKARDRYGKLLAAGLTAMILTQAVINLCAVTGLAPLTGVPLPFVSYGNSSLLVSLAAIGLLLNIARANERGVAAGRPAASGPRGRRATGRLRAVDGGRASPRGRSSASRASSAKGRNSGGGNRRPRRAGDRRRRRTAG